MSARRLSTVLLSIVGLWLAVFLAIRVVPGDPAAILLGERATAADQARLRERMHLAGPLWQQLAGAAGDVLDGSMGTSYALAGRPRAVRALLSEAIGPTGVLAFAALLVAVAIAIPLGSLAARSRGGLFDGFGRGIALIAMSTPVFVSGPLAIVLFAVTLQWAPTPAHPPSALRELALPALVLGFALAARLSRLLRATLLAELAGPLADALRARGHSEPRIWMRHLLPNALVPLLAVIGGQLGALLGGAIVTEKIFGRPGLGTLLLDAIAARDPAVVQGAVLAIAVAYALVLGTVDALVARIDPRTRARADEATA
ncbi:MAG: ABC transporter permease [Deltaproteobacteria bacterium]|nr:ABC transporter permease [Deltaproteobacteria bacterium]